MPPPQFLPSFFLSFFFFLAETETRTFSRFSIFFTCVHGSMLSDFHEVMFHFRSYKHVGEKKKLMNAVSSLSWRLEKTLIYAGSDFRV